MLLISFASIQRPGRQEPSGSYSYYFPLPVSDGRLYCLMQSRYPLIGTFLFTGHVERLYTSRRHNPVLVVQHKTTQFFGRRGNLRLPPRISVLVGAGSAVAVEGIDKEWYIRIRPLGCRGEMERRPDGVIAESGWLLLKAPAAVCDVDVGAQISFHAHIRAATPEPALICSAYQIDVWR